MKTRDPKNKPGGGSFASLELFFLPRGSKHYALRTHVQLDAGLAEESVKGVQFHALACRILWQMFWGFRV